MTKNGAVIMDCEFFPSIPWFKKFMDAENVSIEQHEFFVRSSFSNRAYVAGPNGVIGLTVPLQGGRNQRKTFKELKIAYDEDWQALHWKSLTSFYGRSVYFEYFKEELADFYAKKFEYLLEANLASLDLILKLLQIKKEYTLTDHYEKNAENDCRHIYLPKNRRIENVDKEYFQPFSDRNGFEPNLSMLDFLFCCGRWE
jgi:hypothetical protein